MKPTPASTKSSDVLLTAAARLVRKDGWCQRTASKYDMSGRRYALCARTALGVQPRSLEVDESESGFETRRFLMRALNKDPLDSIVFWNDEPGRTQLEVVEAFVRAAKLALGEGK